MIGVFGIFPEEEMVKTVPRIAVQENGNGEKTTGRAMMRSLPLEGGKVAEPTAAPRRNGSKRWADMSEAEKKRSREYQKKWRANRKLTSKKEKLPFPFKFCPDCAGTMPTITYNNATYLRPCHFCPDCGYQIPIMPKSKTGGGKAK